jgi:hypothetical protein
MNASSLKFIHGLLFSVGLVLMVGGIVTGFHGASIIGLIVAAVNLRQWLNMNNNK